MNPFQKQKINENNVFVEQVKKYYLDQISSQLSWTLEIKDEELHRDFEAFSRDQRSSIFLFAYSLFKTFYAFPVETMIFADDIIELDSGFKIFSTFLYIALLLTVGTSWFFLFTKKFPSLNKFDKLNSTLFLFSITVYVILRMIRYTIYPCHKHVFTEDLYGRECDSGEYSSLPWDSGAYIVIPPIIYIYVIKETRFPLVFLSFLTPLITIGVLILAFHRKTFSFIFFWVVVGFFLIIDIQYQHVKTYFMKRKLVESLVEIENMSAQTQAQEMRHMIANVAHDLKTPLSSFISGVDIIEQVLQECEQSYTSSSLTVETCYDKMRSIGQYLEDIRNTNSFMLMTINRCIDYTKASKGMKLVPRYETIDLLETLRLPLNCMRNIQNRIQICLKPITEDICTHIMTDKQWLQENILCLLSNAVKYSSGGEVTITVSLENNTDCLNDIIVNNEMKLKLITPKKPKVRNSLRILPTIRSFHSSHSLHDRELSVDSKGILKSSGSSEASKSNRGSFESAGGSRYLRDSVHSTNRRDSALSANRDSTISTDSAQGSQKKPKRNSLTSVIDIFSGNKKNHRDSVASNPESKKLEGEFTDMNAIKDNPIADEEKAVEQHKVIRFEVEDTGIGMSDEAMKYLFNPFKQNQRLAGGTGLGLYSLAKRVEALNGNYGVKKRKDGKQGSLFWFTIPYKPDETLANMLKTQQAEANEKKPFTRASIRLGNVRRASSIVQLSRASINNLCLIQEARDAISNPSQLIILMADDSPTILKMASMMLRKQGHIVDTVDNGAMAVQKIEEKWKESSTVYDLVLMDLQMPVMDGLEATKRIRSDEDSLSKSNNVEKNKIRPHQMIVGCSANSDSDTTDEAFKAGVDSFMSKPFSMDSFQATAKALVKRLTQSEYQI